MGGPIHGRAEWSLGRCQSASGRDQRLLFRPTGSGAPTFSALPLSAQINLALGVIDLLTADGSLARVSAFYVPPSVGGQVVASATDAERFARSHLDTKLQQWARGQGRTVECVFACKGNAPTYRSPVGDAGGQPLHISLYVHPMVPARPDPLRDALLGFSPAWQSPQQNGLGLCVTANSIPTEGGAMVTASYPGLGQYAKHPCASTFSSRAERDLLRALTADGFYTYASRWAGANVAAFQGKVFEITSTRAKAFIGDTIIEVVGAGE